MCRDAGFHDTKTKEATDGRTEPVGMALHRAFIASWRSTPVLSYLTLRKVSAPNIKMQKTILPPNNMRGASRSALAGACEATTFDCVAF